jgi:protein SCO1
MSLEIQRHERTKARRHEVPGVYRSIALAIMLVVSLPTLAQFAGPLPQTPIKPKDADVAEKLGDTIPVDLGFVDEAGNGVHLADYFKQNRPVVLQLGYYQCPMLCSLVSQGMTKSLQQLTLNPGSEFQVLYVSVDPAEGPELAAGKKASILAQWRSSGASEGLHLLTGKQDAITALTKSVGFIYRWVPDSKQFAHPAVLVVLSPQGKITRYLYGVTFDPTTLRLSLVEAADGKVGSVTDRFILTCFQYDGSVGKYALVAKRLLAGAAAATVLLVVSVIFMLVRRDVRRDRRVRQPG